jgi:hypothetical protein
MLHLKKKKKKSGIKLSRREILKSAGIVSLNVSKFIIFMCILIKCYVCFDKCLLGYCKMCVVL